MDVLFLLAGSADATLEGFQRAKAFVKRFVRAALTGCIVTGFRVRESG